MFATTLKVLKKEVAELLIGKQFPAAEARGLYAMLATGSTVEEIRELIAVPERIEKRLRAWAEESPADAWWIERSLKFRREVLEKFNRLLREGVPAADFPEAEEAESDAGEGVLAGAQSPANPHRP